MAQLAQHISNWFHRQIIIDKFNNPLGYVLFVVIGIGIGTLIASMGIKVGVLLLIAMIGIPILFATMFNSVLGVALAIFIGAMVPYLSKLINAPFGLSLDGLLFVLFFGLILQQIYERDWTFLKNPLAPWVMVWMAYNLLQALNPWAGSRLAWVFTVRSMAGLILLFFIASYAFKNLKSIKFIIEWIIGIAFVSALYGLKQEFIGFSDAELNWLYSDPKRMQLIVQWSRMRVFSFFSDPTNYGIFMAYMANFCIVLGLGKEISWGRRIYLFTAAMCMLLAIGFAGSRTPIVLLPFGLAIYVLLTMKKEVLIGGMIFLVVGSAAMMKSTSNAVIFRIQSAFNLKDSGDTIGVRMRNQEFIQPYIHSHPFGFGMGSTGMWGKRFTPDSFLADFAHDSGFVRVAVEQGWVGLIIICCLLFTVLRLSIYYYIRVKDPYIKQVYLALNVVFFMLILANYPQEALVILPTSLIFYTFLGIMVRLKEFDPAFAYLSETTDSGIDHQQRLTNQRNLPVPK